MKKTTKRILCAVLLALFLITVLCIAVYANGSAGTKAKSEVSVTSYSSEIFSVLTFISSIVLAYLCKKGLMPSLENGIGAISTLVCEIKEAQELAQGSHGEDVKEIGERMDILEYQIKALDKKLDKFESILEKLDTSTSKDEKAA